MSHSIGYIATTSHSTNDNPLCSRQVKHNKPKPPPVPFL